MKQSPLWQSKAKAKQSKEKQNTAKQNKAKQSKAKLLSCSHTAQRPPELYGTSMPLSVVNDAPNGSYRAQPTAVRLAARLEWFESLPKSLASMVKQALSVPMTAPRAVADLVGDGGSTFHLHPCHNCTAPGAPGAHQPSLG
jgi:hypothetical protein